jgi:NDP-sugar pyrophosphorylase family protein
VSVSAILLVGSQSAFPSAWDGISVESESGKADAPVACTEVLGASILEHTIRRLNEQGVRNVFVAVPDALRRSVPAEIRKIAKITQIQQSADESLAIDRLFFQRRAKGVQTILIIRVAAYVEFDLTDILRFHYSRSARVTRVCDNDGRLDFWIINSDQLEGSESASDLTLDHEEATYFLNGYVNHLENPGDLRRLAVDGLRGHCELKPCGREVRAGIWVGEGARIHPSARIVAPCFIGRKADVFAAAVITRCSSLERGSVVGSGTVVEDSSILARTCIGDRLEVSRAVIDGSLIAHLGRNVTVEINDAKLVCRIDPWHFLRGLRSWTTPTASAREAAAIGIVSAVSAVPAPAYANSTKEHYDEWKSCNR